MACSLPFQGRNQYAVRVSLWKNGRHILFHCVCGIVYCHNESIGQTHFIQAIVIEALAVGGKKLLLSFNIPSLFIYNKPALGCLFMQLYILQNGNQLLILMGQAGHVRFLTISHIFTKCTALISPIISSAVLPLSSNLHIFTSKNDLQYCKRLDLQHCERLNLQLNVILYVRTVKQDLFGLLKAQT